MAYCPNCGCEIRTDSKECPKCKADFGPQSTWRPTAEPPKDIGAAPGQQAEPSTKGGFSVSASTGIVIALFALITLLVGYRQVVFQMACHEMAGEKVFESRSNVEGLLIGDAPAWDSNWTTWLVDKGGYDYVDLVRANSRSVVTGYERLFWRSEIKQSGVKTLTSSTAVYEIKVRRTFPKDFIAKWEFEAVDRTNNQILGMKVVLFLQSWWLSRSCPRVGFGAQAGEDLFDFFARHVLVPKAR